MATKPTAAQKRRAALYRDFTEKDYQDPRVLAILRKLEQEEQDQANADTAPSFSNVVGEANTVPSEPGYWEARGNELSSALDFLGGTVDAAQGGLENILGGLAVAASDYPEQASTASQALSPALGPLLSSILQREQGQNALRAIGFGLGEAAQENQQLAQAQVERLPEGADRKIGQAVVDFAQSAPATVGSLFGPAGAGVAGLSTGSTEYLQARRAGLEPDQASVQAGTQGAIETAFSATTGPLSRLLPGAGKPIKDSAIRWLSKTLGTIGVEAVQEASTTAAQIGANQLVSQTVDDQDWQRYSANQTLDAWEQIERAALASIVGSGPIGAVQSSLQVTAENAQLQQKRLAAQARLRRQYGDAPRSNEVDVSPIPARQDDLFPTELGLARISQPTPALDGTSSRITPDQRTEREIAYLERERAEVIRTSNQDNLPEAFARVQEIDAQLEAIRNPQPTQATTALPETGDLFTQQEQNELAAQRATAQKQLKEASSLIAKDRKSLEATAKSSRAAARREFQKNLLTETRSLPEEDRAFAVAEALRQWDSTNPMENFLAKAAEAPAPRKSRTRGRAQTKATPAPTTPRATTAAELLARTTQTQEAPTPASLQSTPAEDTNGTEVTTDEVFSALEARGGKRDSNVVTHLVGDNKLDIVDDESQIPTNASQVTANGWYDGDRMYVVARHLNRDNIVGDLLNVAAHEGHHAAGRSGAVTMRGFVGDPSVNIFIRRVENLAANNNPVALEAKRRADAAEQANPGSYEEELLAYTINAARDARDASGPIARVANSLVSSVRTKAKSAFGINDVNINDVAYLSDKLLENLAQTSAGVTDTSGNQDTRAMTISGGTGAAAALQNNRTWLSVDGKRKYEISDRESRVVPPSEVDLDKEYSITDILKHDKLYEELPELKKVKVKFVEGNDPSIWGGYVADDNTVEINVNSPAISGEDPSAFDGPLHRVLIHEMQHAAQNESGTTGGGSQDTFLTEFEKDIPNQLRTLARWRDAIEQKNPNHPKLEEIEKEIENLRKTRNLSYAKYRAILGELEAFRSQHNINFTEQELDDIGLGKQELYWAQGPHGILSPRGKRLDSSGTRPRTLASTPSTDPGTPVAQWAQGQFRQTVAPNGKPVWENFTNWFGDSKITTRKGEPLRMYHGTNASFDIFKEDHNGLIFVTPERSFANSFAAMSEDKQNRGRTMEVFVNSENPFDYENPKHREAILDDEDARASLQATANGLRRLMSLSSTRDPSYEGITDFTPEGILKAGLWDAIEMPPVVRAIKAQGHDGIYLKEAGTKNLAVFKSSQIKDVEHNNGNFDQSKPSILASTPTTKRRITRTPENRAAYVAKRLLLPNQGRDVNLTKILSRGQGMVAEGSLIADVLGARLSDAFVSNASRLKIKEADLRKQVAQEIDRINEEQDPSKRASMLTALDRKYPGIGRAVQDIRSYKWSLAKKLISYRDRDPEPLTEKEINIYNKIIDNAETWTTRAYEALFGGDRGVKYANRFLKRAEKDPNSDEGKAHAAAVQWLVENRLLIPSDLSALTQEDLKLLYETWIGSTNRISKQPDFREQMEEALANKAGLTDDMVIDKANEIIEDMLRPETDTKTAIGRYYRGGRQNRTILEGRKDIPEELRAVLGEVTDPYVREAISVARLNQLIAKTNVLTEVFEEGGNSRWWSDNKSEGFTRQLSGEGFGPLDGKYVSREVYDMLSDFNVAHNDFDQSLAGSLQDPTILGQALAGKAIPVLGTLAGLQKINNIVLNGSAALANALGSPFMLSMNGANWKHAGPAIRDTLATVWSTQAKGAKNDRLQRAGRLLRAEVLDSATVGEFKGEIWKTVHRELQKLSEKDISNPHKVWVTVRNALRSVKDVGSLAKELYAFTDVWAKVATFYDRVEFLTEYNKAEGKDWTEDQIERQAAYDASMTNISYNRAVPLIRIFERNVPVIGMFMTYFSEVFRSVGFSAAQVVKDVKLAKQANTTKGKALATKQAATRLAGTTAVTAGVVGLMTSLLNNEDDEEKRRRKLDAEWEANKWHIPLGKDSKGNDLVISMNRIDPLGPLNEPIVDFIQADDKLDSLEKSAKGLFVQSRGIIKSMQVVTDLIAAALGKPEWDKKQTTESAFSKKFPNANEKLINGLSFGDLGENITVALESLMIPATAFAPTLDPDRLNVAEPAKWSGSKEISKTLQWLGYKAYKRDPDKNLSFKAKDYTNGIRQLQVDKKKFLENFKTMDREAFVNRMEDLTDREYKLFRDMSEAYDGYLAYYDKNGKRKTVADANKVLEGKIENTAALRTGRFVPKVVTPRVINEWSDIQIKKLDRRDTDYKEKVRDIKARQRLLRQAYGEYTREQRGR